jgi:drug/metabolite transporter (DMT)-like permease
LFPTPAVVQFEGLRTPGNVCRRDASVESPRLTRLGLVAPIRAMEALVRPVARRPAVRDGTGIILAASVLFGTMAVLVRVAVREVPAVQVTCVRFVGSFLILLATTRGQGLRARRGNGRPLVVRALVGAAAIALYFAAIGRAGAGLATLLQNGYPVFAAIFAALLLGEAFSRRLAAALALNVAGVVLVVAPEARLDPAVAMGALAACGSALLSGGAVVAARHLRRTESASVITTWFMGVGALVTAPALASGLPALSAPLVLALAGVVVTSVAGQWLLHHGLGFISVARGSLMAATSVVTATALEAAFLGQRLGPHVVAGACCMIAAVALATDRGTAVAAGGE